MNSNVATAMVYTRGPHTGPTRNTRAYGRAARACGEHLTQRMSIPKFPWRNNTELGLEATSRQQRGEYTARGGDRKGQGLWDWGAVGPVAECEERDCVEEWDKLHVVD